MSEKNNKVKPSEKSDKPGIFQRIGRFFKEYRGELKKISWPTMAEVIKNTMITLAAVLIIGVVIWVFDYAVTTLRDIVISTSSSDVVKEEGTDSKDTLSNGDALELPSNGDVNTSSTDTGAEG